MVNNYFDSFITICSSQILYGYSFWSFYQCFVHKVQIQVLFDPILHSWCHNWGKGFKNFIFGLWYIAVNCFEEFGKVTSNMDPCFTPEIFISWKNKITCLGLTLIMTLFSQIVLDTQIWVSFEPILEWHQNEGLGMGHIIILNAWSQKGITNLKKNIVTEFDLFITVGIEYTNMAHLWLNFNFMTSQGLLKSQILEKMMKNQIFHLKKNKHDSKFRTFCCCLVEIYCFQTALKNLEKWHQRGTPVSHPSFS